MNPDELLSAVRGKSRREVEAVLARCGAPRRPTGERVLPVREIREGREAGGECTDSYRRSGGESLNTEGESGEVVSRFKLTFTVSPEFMKKFERVQALLVGSHGKHVTLEAVFERLLDDYLDRHSPERQMARRAAGRSQRKASAPEPAHACQPPQPTENTAERRGRSHKQPQPPGSRHIPARIRDEVFVRDGGQCRYISANGVRCSATRGLQVDHLIPYARGGAHSPENLRLLCPAHNQLEADRVYGATFMSCARG